MRRITIGLLSVILLFSGGAAQAADTAAVPDAPSDVHGTLICNDVGCFLHLAWTAPDDHGSPITAYTIAGDPSVAPHTVNGSTTELDESGWSALPPAADGTYTVVATNANGSSAPGVGAVEVHNNVFKAPATVTIRARQLTHRVALRVVVSGASAGRLTIDIRRVGGGFRQRISGDYSAAPFRAVTKKLTKPGRYVVLADFAGQDSTATGRGSFRVTKR